MPVGAQATALNWLLNQVPSWGTIDVVGFGLGGVIADYWAATQTRTSALAQRIHAVVTIESPVGGFTAAQWAGGSACVHSLDRSRCRLVQNALEQVFGAPIVQELDPGAKGNIVEELKNATRFPVYSIQSTNDYLVNGKGVAVCSTDRACNAKRRQTSFGLALGKGTQGWRELRGPSHTGQALGGTTVGPLDFRYDALKRLGATLGNPRGSLWKDHTAPLHNASVRSWVSSALKA